MALLAEAMTLITLGDGGCSQRLRLRGSQGALGRAQAQAYCKREAGADSARQAPPPGVRPFRVETRTFKVNVLTSSEAELQLGPGNFKRNMEETELRMDHTSELED
ncbi:hypothetical protein CB1_000294027 [Camelus ferus]|nr:hypothetical protein CB1_000294027 [Camelus ferus]